MQPYIHQETLLRDIHNFFAKKQQIVGDKQDNATFLVEEAVELLDCFMREKPYNRNHVKNIDKVGHEAAQVLMMLILTCDVAGIDLEDEFIKLMKTAC